MKRVGAFLRKLLLGDDAELVIVGDEKTYATNNHMRSYLGIDHIKLCYSRVVKTSMLSAMIEKDGVDVGYNVEADVYLIGVKKPVMFTLPFLKVDSDHRAIEEALDWISVKVEEIRSREQRAA